DMGRYSLWLIPCGDQAQRLAETIERLGRDHGGPRFDPHLTLLGGLEGAEERFVAATERLAASLRPITLQLRGVEFGDERYRCLYLRVARRGDLMAAHREALHLFGRSSDPSFMPHLSLFYGSLSPASRTRIAATLAEWRSVSCRTGRLRLVKTGGEPSSWNSARDCALNPAQPAG
ncbi:MAG TPA: 2'-5' RNA ligase family protein, partial [Candidatus Polarisedimenticolia bacterium]|nr:2'-5' RNA ligase family protein [Candidatus Polarisedimenticolia bacterium]